MPTASRKKSLLYISTIILVSAYLAYMALSTIVNVYSLSRMFGALPFQLVANSVVNSLTATVFILVLLFKQHRGAFWVALSFYVYKFSDNAYFIMSILDSNASYLTLTLPLVNLVVGVAVILCCGLLIRRGELK